MDLVVILKALMMGVIALFMIYIVMLMLRNSPDRTPPSERTPRRVCGGTRDGRECGAPLFQCYNCKEEGCQMKACDNRGFKAPGTCLRCGFGNAREPV